MSTCTMLSRIWDLSTNLLWPVLAADGYLNGLTLYFVGYVLFEVCHDANHLVQVQAGSINDMTCCPDSMQHCAQEDDTEDLAPDLDHRLGRGVYATRYRAQLFWLSCCSILSRCGRVGSLSRCGVLFFHVVCGTFATDYMRLRLTGHGCYLGISDVSVSIAFPSSSVRLHSLALSVAFWPMYVSFPQIIID
jgi:hypothetical protein